MKKAELEVKLREGKKKAERTKAKNAGLIPAVVYGRGIKNITVAVDPKQLEKTISGDAGRNVIISLKITDGTAKKPVSVLTHDIQRNPLNDKMIHVDFLRINMEEKLKTKVPVEISGMSVGVKEQEGILVHGLREIEVKCLPGDIPDKFMVDVTPLKINESLHVSDLKVAPEIEILSSPEEMVVNISPPTKEEELAPIEEVTAAEVPSEKGAAPEAVPAEGEKGAEKKGAEKKAEKKAEGAAPAAEKKAPAAEKKAPPEKK